MNSPTATKVHSLHLSLIGFTFCLLLASDGRAATLFGKVIEVNDGDEITVFNLNRPVRVKLLGIDAPESNQPFGDIARQHLRDLVFDKLVTVEYSGLGQHSLLMGRALLNGTDIGAQMIRDGVAWFDRRNKGQLSDSDCDIYSRSEEAARSEKRGLWQTEGAVAPWQFVSTETNKRETMASFLRATMSPRPDKLRPELNSESLIGRRSAPNGTNSSDLNGTTAEASAKSWETFHPEGQNFSALLPTGGKQLKDSVSIGNRMADINSYMARDGSSIYAVMWTTGPFSGETDAAAMNDTLRGFLNGVGAAYESIGGKFVCEPQGASDISLNGYKGSAFNLQGCTIPAVVHSFTRVTSEQREIYLGAVFFRKDDVNVHKFLDSFSVGEGSRSRE